ncbi:MAG: response regulator [Myxococcaceae bacterium]|nr:MAG: response regulator [Myxococcaceae bacterium]
MSPPSQSRDTLLLIEDDADIRESLIDLLKEAGHAVVTAGDGTEALRMLDAGAIPRPCLVLLDWLMRPMSGEQFLEAIQDRSDAADLRVLIVSAATDLHHAASLPGVVGVLRKPFEIDDLLERVGAHCGAARSRAALA